MAWFDLAGKAVAAQVQPLGQLVGILWQAGEARPGQDGQLQQEVEVGGAGGRDDEDGLTLSPDAGL